MEGAELVMRREATLGERWQACLACTPAVFAAGVREPSFVPRWGAVKVLSDAWKLSTLSNQPGFNAVVTSEAVVPNNRSAARPADPCCMAGGAIGGVGPMSIEPQGCRPDVPEEGL